jgi:hypothetical protein
MRFAGVISSEFWSGQFPSFTGWQTPLPKVKIVTSQVHLNQKRPMFRFIFRVHRSVVPYGCHTHVTDRFRDVVAVKADFECRSKVVYAAIKPDAASMGLRCEGFIIAIAKHPEERGGSVDH